jgi:hypothetical protein
LTATQLTEIQAELARRWPLISRWLLVSPTGRVDFDSVGWFDWEGQGVRGEKLAAAFEQRIAYYEWRLAQRAEELAADRLKRYLVEKWTDTMTYDCQRSATLARGHDPGEWIPLNERRPDLAAEGQAITDEIIARLHPHHDRDRQLVGAGVAGSGDQ